MSPMRSALYGATLLVVSGALTGRAAAADDGYDNVFSSVLTAVGLLKADSSPEIDYRERAPLVLPPKMALEKPIPEGANRTAAWPQDPDVVKRRRAAEEARAPMPNLLGNPNALSSRDELLNGRTASGESDGGAQRNRCGSQGNQRGCLVLSPDALRAEDERYKASGAGSGDKPKQEIAAGEEPDRMYLTQPPKGYLKTTKTVKVTAEAPKPVIDQANPAAALVYRDKSDD